MSSLTAIIDRFFPPNPHIANDSERQSTRYLGILMLFLALVDVISIVATLLINGLRSSVFILSLGVAAGVVTFLLMRSVYYRMGQWVGLVAITTMSIGLIYATPTPPQLLVAIFPVFYVSLYIQPRYTYAASVICLSALVAIAPQINGKVSDVLLCLGLTWAACVVINVQTMLMWHTKTAADLHAQRLAESEARFRSAIDGSPDAFFLMRPIKDASNKVTDFEVITTNERVLAMFGISKEAFIGKTLRMIYPDVHNEALFQTAIEVLTVGQAREQEYDNRHGRIFSIQLVPTLDGIAVTMSDITERKASENIRRDIERLSIELENERKMGTLRGNLMATISHEFRTPLAVIMNNTEILERYYQRLTDKQREERVHAIKDHILQITTMLDNITQIIRGQNQHLQFRPELADLEQYLATLFSQISETLGTDHEMKLMQEGDLRRCYVDLTLIHQIVTNLLSNALKFSAAGSLVQLNVRGTDDTLELVVTDAGIGIPESDLEHIFEPFFRASNIGEVRGTGLGMAIVRDCVDIQEGTLDVKSVKGEGTTVTIRLPRQPLPDDVTLPSVSGG